MSICVFKRLVRPQSASHDGIGRDADAAKRLREIRARLWALGPTRQLRFPVAQWRQRLAQLEQDFPNFSAVIRTIVRPHLSLLSRHVAHRMTPILLVGSPGIGKTQFARELESILAVPALFISMCDESNNSALAGSSTFWSNSSPGKLFEQLAWGSTEFEGGGTANALVIVDEVDKVSASHYDPLGALYGLLEQETARRFEDQSVPGQVLDMSHMRFILTANDEMRIPEPLRSRVCTFHIEVPGEHEVQTIACRIYHSLLVRYQIEFEPSIPPAVLKEIAGLSPRHLKTRLEAALAIALSHGKTSLDIESWMETEIGARKVKPGMGFI